MMEKDIQEVLFSEETLKECVAKIGRQIAEDYEGKEIDRTSVV